MTAAALPAWLSAELNEMNHNSEERLEEFAFCVSQDIKWLNEFTRSFLEEPIAGETDIEPSTIFGDSRTPLQQLEPNVCPDSEVPQVKEAKQI